MCQMKRLGAADEASHHSMSSGMGREGFSPTSCSSLGHCIASLMLSLDGPAWEARGWVPCPRVPWMNVKTYPALYGWIISDCSCMLSCQCFHRAGKQARTLHPLRLSCREKVLPTDCILPETDIVQGQNKRKIKGLGLLFLLLPSDCCKWLPTATGEAVSCRAAGTRDR